MIAEQVLPWPVTVSVPYFLLQVTPGGDPLPSARDWLDGRYVGWIGWCTGCAEYTSVSC